MYVSLGSVKETCQWFASQDTASLMLLYVAADIEDGALIRDFWEHGPALDALSGEEIVVMLFALDRQVDLRRMVAVARADNDFLVLPGEALLMPQWRPWQSRSLVRVDQCPSDVTGYVISRSQTASLDLRKEFTLSDEDVPCVLVLTRDSPEEPFVLRTSGAASVAKIWDLIGDLRSIAKTLTLGSIEGSTVSSSLAYLLEAHAPARAEFQRADADRQAAFARLDRALDEAGFQGVSSYLAESSKPIFDVLGLRRDKLRECVLPSDRKEAMGQAARVATVHSVLRDLEKVQRRWRSAKTRLDELEVQISRIENYQAVAQVQGDRLQTAEERIQEICNQYARAFHWRRRMRPLIRAARGIGGASKAAKDLTSLRAAIARLGQ